MTRGLLCVPEPGHAWSTSHVLVGEYPATIHGLLCVPEPGHRQAYISCPDQGIPGHVSSRGLTRPPVREMQGRPDIRPRPGPRLIFLAVAWYGLVCPTNNDMREMCWFGYLIFLNETTCTNNWKGEEDNHWKGSVEVSNSQVHVIDPRSQSG